jgi:AmiR/NasT family two-component response regulator
LAALTIATTMQSKERGKLVTQLQRALDARVLIEQAKGILLARGDVDPRAAFEELRATARSTRRRLADVAAEVVRQSMDRPEN